MPEIKSNTDFIFYVLTIIYLYLINNYYRGRSHEGFHGDQCINETVVDQNVCLPENYKAEIIKRRQISKYLNKVFKVLFGDSVEYTELLVYFTIYLMINRLVFEPIVDYTKNFIVKGEEKKENITENEKRGFNLFIHIESFIYLTTLQS